MNCLCDFFFRDIKKAVYLESPWRINFNLVSDFYSRWNFWKNGFELFMIRCWFIYIFDIKTIKVTFSSQKFSMITSFTKKIFSCFFWKRLNNSAGYVTPDVMKWLIWINHLVAPLDLFVISSFWPNRIDSKR